MKVIHSFFLLLFQSQNCVFRYFRKISFLHILLGLPLFFPADDGQDLLRIISDFYCKISSLLSFSLSSSLSKYYPFILLFIDELIRFLESLRILTTSYFTSNFPTSFSMNSLSAAFNKGFILAL